MPHSEIPWLCLALVVGTVVGSFLNVLVHRLPIMLREADPELSLWSPRSHCPACRSTLRPLHLVPILGYLWLRGRCAFCRAPIAVRYPLLELVAGLLAVAAVAGTDSLLEAGAWAALGWGLLTLAVIDWQTQLLPDLIVHPLLWLGLLVNITGQFAPLHEAVLGAVAGYLSFWILAHLFRALRKQDGLGGGDLKMFALCGAWIGWTGLPSVALIASLLTLLLGLVHRLRGAPGRALPFGPALALALFGLLLGQHVLDPTAGGAGP